MRVKGLDRPRDVRDFYHGLLRGLISLSRNDSAVVATW